VNLWHALKAWWLDMWDKAADLRQRMFDEYPSAGQDDDDWPTGFGV